MVLHAIDGTRIWDLPFRPGQTILQVLQENGITGVHSPCGGKGLCKKCTVTVHNALESYTCLACITPAEEDMRVELNYKRRISFSQDSSCPIFPADPGQSGYAIACDVGTQKILCTLMQLETGDCIGTELDSNIQRIFGADSHSLSEEETDSLRNLIRHQINLLIDRLCGKAGIPNELVTVLTVVGGTAMMRILEGGSPSSPFSAKPMHASAPEPQHHGFHINGIVFFAPVLSSGLGSDVSACILAADLAAEEKPVLLLDFGTHSKLVLGCGNRYVACSAQTGPALRGGFYDYGTSASKGAIAGLTYQNGTLKPEILGKSLPTGVCGSGVIEAISIMLRLGILDAQGNFRPREQLSAEAASLVTTVNGEPAFKLTKFYKIYVTQSDVTRFLEAKAMLHAAIVILLQEYGIALPEVSKLMLAGGLGSFLHQNTYPDMVPRELSDRTVFLGNAAGAGCQSAALSARARAELMALPEQVRCIDLTSHPDFAANCKEGMQFFTAVHDSVTAALSSTSPNPAQ